MGSSLRKLYRNRLDPTTTSYRAQPGQVVSLVRIHLFSLFVCFLDYRCFLFYFLFFGLVSLTLTFLNVLAESCCINFSAKLEELDKLTIF